MSYKISPEKFFNDFASSYDQMLDKPDVKAEYIYEAARIFNQSNPGSAGKVLDVGCGTGFIKELLAGDFEYTGIDVSEKMLHYASQRGYETIHRSVEDVLPTIPSSSYDYVFALSSLLFIEDVRTAIDHISRIARKSFLLSLDHILDDYNAAFAVQAYDHSSVSILNATTDYFIHGWTSPTTGIDIRTRMIYVEK